MTPSMVISLVVKSMSVSKIIITDMSEI